MGNCVSQDPSKFFPSQRHNELFAADNPYVFRVFYKKRNKFIPGLLKVGDCEILFSRGADDLQSWPLQFLRRYGYTYAGIFFFESGRRCPTGEGYHAFQSHQAERIFQLVQARIQRNARYLCSARSSCSSSVTGSRIHPLQKFSSEGANVGADYLNPNSPSLFYHSYHRSNSRQQVRRPIITAPPPSRPRSVASAIEHSSVLLPSSCHLLQRQKSSASDALSFHGSETPCFTDIANEQVLNADDERTTHAYVNVPARSSDRIRTINRSGTFTPYYSNDAPRHANRFFPEKGRFMSAPTNELDYVSVCRSSDRNALRNSESASSRASSTISYAKIDLDKTKALEQAVHIEKLENGRNRQYC